jgi:hypothetical protein
MDTRHCKWIYVENIESGLGRKGWESTSWGCAVRLHPSSAGSEVPPASHPHRDLLTMLRVPVRNTMYISTGHRHVMGRMVDREVVLVEARLGKI